MVFDFKYAPKPTERSDSLDEAKKYINATVTQLFYTSNMFHDLLYRYVIFPSLLPLINQVPAATVSTRPPATSNNTISGAVDRRMTP
jgi:hypothetical protein